MRYRIETSDELRGEAIERHDYPSPPPSYDMSHGHNIAPPEYQDAFQDVLLEAGDSSSSGQAASESFNPSSSSSL